MAVIDCNADGQANALFTSLTADAPTPPVLDLSDDKFDFIKDLNSELYQDANIVTLEQLTEVTLEGDGVFDKLMQAVDLHIQREYKGNRITGDQYAKVYTDVTTAVLGQSVSFLLQKDQAKWAGIIAQMQARIAEIQATEALISLEKTKVETQEAVFRMQNAGAAYALTKMQIANADAAYCLTQAQTAVETYKLDFLMPVALGKEEHLLNLQMPAQTDLIKEQREAQRAQTLETRSDMLTPITGLLGRQKNLLDKQIILTGEQVESERSKTLDTRTDNTTVIEGSVGKQKDLYDQQIDSFVKDAKQKAAKMYLDGWITQKTLDENLAAPNELDVPSVSAVLLALRNENGL